MEKLKKHIFIIVGSFFVVLGILGIILPLLPTTLFLLLAAYFYAKGSTKMYDRLISNKYLGGFIKDYRDKRGIHWRNKITSISLIWVTIILSVLFVIPLLWVKVVVLIIAVAVTIYLLSIKTLY